MNNNDKKHVLINSIIITTASLIDKLIFFIISVIIARYLTKSDYGEYSTALNYAHFFAIFISLGIDRCLVRAVNLDQALENIHLTNSILLKGLLSVAIFIVLAISVFFTGYNHNTVHLIIVFAFVRIGNEFLNLYYAYYDAKERFITTTIFTSSFSILFLVSTIIIMFLNGTYFHFAYSRFIIIASLILIASVVTFKKLQFRYNFSLFPGFIRDSMPFNLQTIYYNIYNRMNFIIISTIHGTIYSGYFQNGFLFFFTLTFIPDNFIRILVPYLYKFDFKKEQDKFQFTFDIFNKVFGIISFFLFIIFFIFSPGIITLLFSNKYVASIPVLKILAFGIPFMFNISSTILIALDLQKYNTRILGIAALVNIVANVGLIYFYKAEGAALAIVITYMIIFVLSTLYLYQKKYILLKTTISNYIKLVAISILSYYAYALYFHSFHSLYSIMLTSAVYGLLVLLFLIRKDDIRIIREAIGAK